MPSSGKLSKPWRMEKNETNHPVKLIAKIFMKIWTFTLPLANWLLYLARKCVFSKYFSRYPKAQYFKANFPWWFSWTHAKQHMEKAICNVLLGHFWVITSTVYLKSKCNLFLWRMKSFFPKLLPLKSNKLQNWSFRHQWMTTFKVLPGFWTHQPHEVSLLKNSSNYGSQTLEQANQNTVYSFRKEVSLPLAQQRVSQGSYTWSKQRKTTYIAHSSLIQTN